MARVIRVAMPPEHPIRRLMSIFTFGAIFVNLQAMHTLIGTNHMLHRATPFNDFQQLSQIVPSGKSGLMADIQSKQGIKELFDDDEFDKMHPKLQKAPMFADGRMLAKALQKLVEGISYNSMHLFCDVKGDYNETLKHVAKEWVT